MLDPAEALFFGGGDELAVADETGGGVTVVGVYPEDEHE